MIFSLTLTLGDKFRIDNEAYPDEVYTVLYIEYSSPKSQDRIFYKPGYCVTRDMCIPITE